MKTVRILVLFFAALTLLVVLPGYAAEKTSITSVDEFDPFGLLLGQGPIGAFVNLGTFECPGNPGPPCPAGSRVRIRDMVFYSRHSSPDPRLNGWSTFEFNANWDANGEGTTWGKWKIEVAEGGVWEGVYNGGKPFGERVEFHGTGGAIDGLLLKLESSTGTMLEGGIAFQLFYAGYIVDPKARE